jgi:hypothetical protein
LGLYVQLPFIGVLNCRKEAHVRMIELLSAVGRVVIVVAAVLTVISCTIAGYLFARTQEFATYSNFTISGGGQITPLEIVYSLFGGGIGVVVSGAIFGAIATLYDIRDSLRSIAKRNRGDQSPGELPDQPMATRVRREPRIE